MRRRRAAAAAAPPVAAPAIAALASRCTSSRSQRAQARLHLGDRRERRRERARQLALQPLGGGRLAGRRHGEPRDARLRGDRRHQRARQLGERAGGRAAGRGTVAGRRGGLLLHHAGVEEGDGLVGLGEEGLGAGDDHADRLGLQRVPEHAELRRDLLRRHVEHEDQPVEQLRAQRRRALRRALRLLRRRRRRGAAAASRWRSRGCSARRAGSGR